MQNFLAKQTVSLLWLYTQMSRISIIHLVSKIPSSILGKFASFYKGLSLCPCSLQTGLTACSPPTGAKVFTCQAFLLEKDNNLLFS